MGVKWFQVLVCISLITDHVEHLFTSLLTYFVSLRNVCWSPLPVLNWVICFLSLLWVCGSSLYIGDLNLFRCIMCRYSLPLAVLFSFRQCPLMHKQSWKLCWKSCSSVVFFFSCLCFWCRIPKVIAKSSISDIPPYVFISKISQFQLLSFRVCDLFISNFCIWFKVRVQPSFFSVWLSSFANTIYWKTL